MPPSDDNVFAYLQAYAERVPSALRWICVSCRTIPLPPEPGSSVLSFELSNGNAMALAYGQVNASCFGCVSGDQSSSGGRLKTGRQVCSSSNAPNRGMANVEKTLPTEMIRPKPRSQLTP